MSHKTKPKIGVIGAKGFPAWGGAARANEAIFFRLKDRFDVIAYAISSHAKDENYHGIKQIIFTAHKNNKISVFFYYIKSLLNTLFRGKNDLIHVNHAAAGFLIPFLKIRFRTVLNVRGMSYNHDNKWKWYEKIILNFFHLIGFKFADKIITVQKSSVQVLENYNPGNVIFIPNGVDYDNNRLFADLPVDYDITFSAARIISLKGLHVLLGALNNINFDGKVQIIGDIDQVPEYKKSILKLSENLNCEFTGLIQDKTELFKKISQSRLFVFPSFTEGMSNMLLEVASLNIPIIAGDIVQNTDVFNDEEALFFGSGDPTELSNKISFAMNNPDMMAEKANRAYQKILQNHDWDIISKEYAKVYQGLIGC